MTVRTATFADIPRIVELGRQAHARTVYADLSEYDEDAARQLCARSLQRNGQTNYGGTMFLVSETEGEVRGFIIGFIDQVYPAFTGLSVTDIFFAFPEDANPRDAITMIAMLSRWAEKNPKVIEVHLGVTDAMNDDWERVGRLYERLGLEKCGGMYRKLLSRGETAEAKTA